MTVAQWPVSSFHGVSSSCAIALLVPIQFSFGRSLGFSGQIGGGLSSFRSGAGSKNCKKNGINLPLVHAQMSNTFSFFN